MKTKVQKKLELGSLKEKLPQSTITIFTTFSREGTKGLSVAQMQELKRALRQLRSEYRIAKKSLTDIVVKDLHYDGIDVYGMPGSLGVVIGPPAGGEDGYAIAKKVYEFAKKNEALKLFGAFFDGHVLTQEELLEMAKMPSHDELIARLLGMLLYPISSLAIVLKQIGETKEKSQSAQQEAALADLPADEAGVPAAVAAGGEPRPEGREPESTNT